MPCRLGGYVGFIFKVITFAKVDTGAPWRTRRLYSILTMDLNKPTPSYLLEKGNITRLILLTAAFALVFINVYEPFNSRHWLPDMSNLMYFALSSLLVIMGMAVVAVSRIIMYHRITKGKRKLSISGYLMWIAAEVVSMSLAFCILEVLCFDDHRDITELIKISFANTTFVLLIPYSVLWLYFSWRDKNEQLKEGVVPEGAPKPDLRSTMIPFFDSRGVVRLSIKLSDLLYIQSANNYVTVYYSENQKVNRRMVRITMHELETMLADKGVVRCHRSYMVNTMHIKVFERVRDGFTAQLEGPALVSVPVSKNYASEVINIIS